MSQVLSQGLRTLLISDILRNWFGEKHIYKHRIGLLPLYIDILLYMILIYSLIVCILHLFFYLFFSVL